MKRARRRRGRALAAATAVIVSLGVQMVGLGPASAADDGYLYRVVSGVANCPAGATGFQAAGSIVSVNYPAVAPAGVTLTNENDIGGGFGAPTDVTSALQAAGNVGNETFYGVGIGIAPPQIILLRITLLLSGTPTYQQIVQVNCTAVGTGTVSVVSENLFPTADPPVTPQTVAPVPVVVAQATTTG